MEVSGFEFEFEGRLEVGVDDFEVLCICGWLEHANLMFCSNNYISSNILVNQMLEVSVHLCESFSFTVYCY